jgi:non-heme chloroperoxidase
MVKSDSNPDGLPIEVFDGIRAGVQKDASQFYAELAEPFFGANRAGSSVSAGAKREFWRQGMLVNLAAACDCVKAFSEGRMCWITRCSPSIVIMTVMLAS